MASIPSPTIEELIVQRVDLHEKLDALLRQFHRDHPGLRLKPGVRTSWGELRFDLEVRFAYSAHATGTCDMGAVWLALCQLQDSMSNAIRSFLRAVPQLTPSLEIDYINGEAQATLHLTLQ